LFKEDKIMSETIEKGLKKFGVTVSKPVLALIAIIFGILVIAFPDLLQWIVGLYFIIQGLLFFADYFELRVR
jgi:hypothetical protein